MRKYLVMAAACVLLLATATAQERPPSAGTAAESMTASENTGFRADTTDVVANAWNWYRPQRTWNYFNGTAQRLWMDMQNSSDWIETNASNTQADQMNGAVTGNTHWLGIYWVSTSNWTSSQFWYY